MKKYLIPFLLLIASCAYGISSIDDTVPATGTKVISSEIRNNFVAIKDRLDGYLTSASYASINEAATACSNTTLVVNEAETLTANLTFPATCEVVFTESGKLVKASTYTVTFATGSTLRAGDSQIFDGFSAGDVFFNIKTPEIKFRWFGATGDGTTNDSPAIQAAYDSLQPGGGTKLICNAGDVYKLDTVINYPTTTSQQAAGVNCGGVSACGSASFTVEGAVGRNGAWPGCTFKAGTDGMTMINHASSISPARYADAFSYKNIRFFGDSKASLIMQIGNAVAGYNITHVLLDSVIFESVKAGGTGLKTGPAGGGSTADWEIRNSLFEFGVASTSNIGIDLSAVGLRIFGGTIATGGGKGVLLRGATEVDLHGTIFSGNNVDLFATLDTGAEVQCFGCWFENALTAIYDNDFSSATAMYPLSFYGCRFDIANTATNLFDFTNHGASDNRAKVYIYGGSLGEAAHDIVVSPYTDIYIDSSWAKGYSGATKEVDWNISAGGTVNMASATVDDMCYYFGTNDDFCFRYDETTDDMFEIEANVNADKTIKIENIDAGNVVNLQIDGNIGVGTTTSANKLDVEGGVAIGATYSGTSAAPTNGLIVEGNVGIGVTSPSAKLDIAAGTTTTGQMHFASSVLKTTPAEGDLEYSAGHWYITNGARHSIDSTSGMKVTNTTVANSSAETTIYSYTFAAGELHIDEHVFSRISGVVSNKSAADDYTIRFKIGGVTIHTISRLGGNVSNVGWTVVFDGTIRTDGASGTFVDNIQWNEDTQSKNVGDATTHAINTTISQLFEVTVQWATADVGNTITCNQGFLTFKH